MAALSFGRFCMAVCVLRNNCARSIPGHLRPPIQVRPPKINFATNEEKQSNSLPSKFYRFLINTADPFVPAKFRPLWEHPAGPKYVFFWLPFVKWGMVLAGLSDLKRPGDKINLPQTSCIAITGVFWARYSTQIIPINYSLMTVNLLVFITQAYLFAKGLMYKREIGEL